jgi:hypothetical protein
MSVRAAANECIVARRCQLVPYNGPKDGISGCCPSQTPDHLIPQASFYDKDGYRKGKGTLHGDWPNYNKGDAPCMCAEGPNNVHGSHGLRHAHHKANGGPEQPGQNVSFDKEAKLGADGACEVFAISACHPDCIEAQLKKGHENMGKTNGCVTRRPSGSVVDEEEISPRATEYAAEAIARG